MSTTDTDIAPGRAAEGPHRPVDPAQGGPAARPGPGRLLRRRAPARHGLRPLRPLAARAREDRLDRRHRRARARRRLRDADRRRGRDPDRSVLRDVDAARRERSRTTRSRSARRASWASRSRPSARARASSRATPPSSSRSSTSRSTCSSTRARRSRTRRSCTTTPARTSSGAASSTGATGRRRRPRPTTSSRSTSCTSTASARRRSSAPARSSSTSGRAASGRCTATTRCPASARSGWRPRCAPASTSSASSPRDIGGGFGNKICLHPYYVTLCLLARKLNRPVQLDRVAHRPAHGERARQRALVPRRRGRGQGRRDDARLQRQGARRLRRLPALRAARLHHLGAGDAGLLRLAEHPRRLHAGDDEQVAGLAEPRLLADAAPLADRADHRHRRRGARDRPGRDAEAQLRQDRADAVRDAERLRLRLRRLRALPRHRARPDRLRHDRGAQGGGGRRAGSCSASGSARRSTPARTTSASRSS